jgi:hypothetical protein
LNPKVTPFILFCQRNRFQVKNENPTWKAPQVTKELSKRWNTLDDEEKETYGLVAVRK